MMGAHHAMTGAAAWIAVTATAGHGFGLFPVTPLDTLVGALVCAGAALLPDADHGSATVAHSIPVLGRVITKGLSQASGGHRHGFHALLAVVCAWLIATGLGFLTWQPGWWPDPLAVGPALMSATAIAVATRALGITRGSWALAWFYGLLIAVLVALFAPEQQAWFVICFTLGYGVHLLGDFLTTGGLPLFWPFVPKPPRWWRKIPILNDVWLRGGNFALPILGNAGSTREWILLLPTTVYVVYGLAFAAFALAGVDFTEFFSVTF